MGWVSAGVNAGVNRMDEGGVNGRVSGGVNVGINGYRVTWNTEIQSIIGVAAGISVRSRFQQ